MKLNNITSTYCVRSVNAADVMEDGRFNPFITSCHNFLLITSTKPPLWTTSLYSSYKSKTDLAIIGNLVTGVSETMKEKNKLKSQCKNI